LNWGANKTLDNGVLRSFHVLKDNPFCVVRPDSDCGRIFGEDFPLPGPIPEDLYAKTGFDNRLGWTLASQEGTGE
jgi:hypothetical protein